MKKIKIISLMLVLVMVLTGCATLDNTLTIQSNGTGILKTVATIEKDTVVAALVARGYTKGEAETFVNTQAIAMGAKKINVNGKEFYQLTDTEKYTKKELAYEALSDYQNGYATNDTYYDILDTSVNKEMLEEYSQFGVTSASLNGLKITYSIVFPNKIVNTNGKIDSQNPNKAVFTIVVGKKNNTIFATTKQGQTIGTVKKIVKKARTIKAPKIKKLKANKVKGKKATITVKIQKVKGAKEYVVEYATSKKFSNSDEIYTKKTTVTLKKLKKNKKYYVRVYAIKKDDRGEGVYSKYSRKKSIKTKK
ncbi:hypothetical protein [uncultured Eubacterium sp.]|uniref:hypothetical protein n=1 Tax=uncultured Eubacterium sp. TaxID=165185 RepID=UPI0026717238|nr:hypothetical protein [uncultured Eubacterium sp.]